MGDKFSREPSPLIRLRLRHSRPRREPPFSGRRAPVRGTPNPMPSVKIPARPFPEIPAKVRPQEPKGRHFLFVPAPCCQDHSPCRPDFPGKEPILLSRKKNKPPGNPKRFQAAAAQNPGAGIGQHRVPLSFHPRIQSVAKPVPQQVESENGQHDGQPGEDHRPRGVR